MGFMLDLNVAGLWKDRILPSFSHSSLNRKFKWRRYSENYSIRKRLMAHGEAQGSVPTLSWLPHPFWKSKECVLCYRTRQRLHAHADQVNWHVFPPENTSGIEDSWCNICWEAGCALLLLGCSVNIPPPRSTKPTYTAGLPYIPNTHPIL